MCQIVGYRDRLITLLFLLAENVLNIILLHFQDRFALYSFETSRLRGRKVVFGLVSHPSFCSSYAYDSGQDTRTITYRTEPDSRDDLITYCEKLKPILERLAGLSEVCCCLPCLNGCQLRFNTIPGFIIVYILPSNCNWSDSQTRTTSYYRLYSVFCHQMTKINFWKISLGASITMKALCSHNHRRSVTWMANRLPDLPLKKLHFS